jgi:putative transposase
MSVLKRYYTEGNTYFIANITHNRKPILIDNIDLFWQSLNKTKSSLHFEMIAWVILPDHFHLLITPDSCTPSDILHRLKLSFGASYRERFGLAYGRVWQRRFWDHIIRNEADLNRHIDYIHYNPVKHGLTKSPFDYQHTSIHDYHKEGYYQSDWGMTISPSVKGEFGE